jgi:inner membrane protein
VNLLPTFFGHAVAGIALGSTISQKEEWLKVCLLSLCCAVLPDIDTIGFRLGIPYEHWLGHRGFLHSIVFSAIMALIAVQFISGKSTKTKYLFFSVLLASGLLHDLLDALTNGGLGVAFFSPFSNRRYFFPWDPIEVSPISLTRFFSPRGFKVIKSEFVWVIMPSLCFMAITAWYKLRELRIQRSSRSAGKR